MTSSFTLDQPTKLEIAHVLFTDIVGYSKLPLDHQKEVLGTLQAVVSSTPEFLRAQASQQMIRLPTGDGMAIVFFEDAEAAARCAIEVSRALKSHPEISLRMGLHSGPVYRVADINANQNVAGGGINIAQRVMDCGDAGHILASQSVADVLGHLSRWKECLHDLGETDVKHGVRLHLYNVYTEEVGNAHLPEKLQTAQRTLVAIRSKARRKKLALGMVAIGVVAALAGWLFLPRHAHALNEKDTIVLTDFANSTGDAVFDDTLKQALAVDLDQSPFLNILSDEKVRAALQQMTRSPNERLTDETAREVCQRAGSKAFISGSIVSLGNQYVIGLKATNCATGDSLAREQVRAADKDKVLDSLGTAATKFRGKLGESLSSVQKFDVPLEQATTSSLEALKAFSIGRKQNSAAAIPYYERALELDPHFAEAYARLGLMYHNIGQPVQASEYITKAFELREHSSEREKLHIASSYYLFVTGEREKAIQTYQLWAQSYPRDWLPYLNIGNAYGDIGQFEKAVDTTRESLKLYPDNVTAYENLGGFYLALNRFPETKDVADQALAHKLDEEVLHTNLYGLAFVQGDSDGMAQQVAWFEGKVEVENEILGLQSATEAYFGHLGKAREVTRRAVASAASAKNKEAAALWSADGAVRETLLGNYGTAREQAGAALNLAPGSRDVESEAALALAIAGDAARAQALADELNKRFPLNTVTQSFWLPAIRGQLEIDRKAASAAVEQLQAAAPYELGLSTQLNYSCIYPAYIRGQAYLAGGQGASAAAEFQKFLDHRGLVQNCPTGALAHLGLARAYVLERDNAKARAAYQDFLTLWKDADPNIPVLIAAKSEYAKLQ